MRKPYLILINFIILLVIFTFSISLSYANLTSVNPFKPKLPIIIKEPDINHTPVPQPEVKKIKKEKEPSISIAPLEPTGNEDIINKPNIIEKIIPLPQLVLNGHVWNSDQPQAIINGEIKQVGERVSFLEIVDINKQGVFLRANDGRTMSLTSGGTK